MKKIKKCTAVCFLFSFLSFSSFSEIPLPPAESDVTGPAMENSLAFKEIWGYVMTGREDSFSPMYPVSDAGYFWSAVDSFGNIPQAPERNKYFSNYEGRVHFTTSCDSRGQTHLLLTEKNLQKRIVKQLIEASATYEGLQIDWELVLKEDDMVFYDFLKTLKKKLKGKILSVAVPARLKTLERDAYDYERLSTVADKIIIMAYDQHWSTSAAGPVASPEWGKRIYEYAKTVIPEEKLILGAPFYGRAWVNEDIGNRAWTNISVERIKKENNVTDKDIKTDKNGNRYFTLEKKRKITLYFDDNESELNRLKLYSEAGASRIAFWRIGQENPELWNFLRLE